MTDSLEITAKIQLRGVNPYVYVTAEQAVTIQPGWRKPMPVLFQINHQSAEPWRTNMMPAGNGDFYLYLHYAMREASQTKVGDVVSLSVRFDETYKNGPQHAMPAWFQRALDKNLRAAQNWDDLPPSRQKEVLRYFAGLKSETARQNNLAKILYVLEGNRGRFMARDWIGGK